ncbi:MAG: hypothetical protein ACYCWN_00130 [Ferrimicrobium sp.]|jgi:hypothetical protein|uniref:hypothetical protein n=1 Tax=Ferrimicrobium sp. TaxID=2926050 RepID=UPI002611613B|nr:hypothetical protein [Ferrimicrobium sp.]MCL5973000.1 hypothetical protein [Actinomycetota bacterium]
MVSFVVIGCLSFACIVGGLLRARSVGGFHGLQGRLALAVVVLGLLMDPIAVDFATRSLWFHALLLVVVSLWLILVVLSKEVIRGIDRIGDRGRLAELGLRWVWGIVVVQDVLLWVGFQDGFERFALRDPVALALLIYAEVAASGAVVFLLSGDGRPRVTHVRQVIIAWSSAMVVMSLGVSLGLSGPWFGFVASSAAALHQQVEQQISAAIFVILGGAPWFLIGTQKMRLWLESEERESVVSFASPVQRFGRSVKVGPARRGRFEGR